MADTRPGVHSSVFKIGPKVWVISTSTLQLTDIQFHTEGVLMLKPYVNRIRAACVADGNSLSDEGR